MRIGVLTSHPIQYQAPMFRALAKQADLTVYFAHRQDAQSQAGAGYGVAFDWNVDLLDGYRHQFLQNTARRPGVDHFFGCSAPEIATLIASGKFDAFIVSGWNLLVYWQAIRACRRHRVPVLARGDSQLGSPRALGWRIAKRLLYPRMFAQIDGFLAVGSRSREYLLHYNVHEGRIFPAQHVVDVERFERDSAIDDRTHSLRQVFDIPPGRQVVAFVGRLIPWKRVDDAVRAIGMIDASRRPVLLVIGDGSEHETIARLARDLNVTCCFAGFCNQAELPSRYALVDALVLPSDGNETWGLVVNEAIASGVPAVVSSAVGCASELVVPGETGQQFGLGDIVGFTEALVEVLGNGRAHYAAALKRCSDWFSPDAAATGIVNAVTDLVRRRRVRERGHH